MEQAFDVRDASAGEVEFAAACQIQHVDVYTLFKHAAGVRLNEEFGVVASRSVADDIGFGGSCGVADRE